MDSRDQAQFRQMQRALQGQLVPRTVTAAATLQLSDYLVACDATSAAFTLTLPAVKDAKGMSFLVVKTDSSANAVTLDGNGSETINGATTLVLSRQWCGVEVYCDGTQWITVIPSALIAATLVLAGALTTTGANTVSAANQGVMDFLSGLRLQGYGADASTNGTVSILTRRSDGTNAVTGAAIDAPSVATETALKVYDVDNATLERVTVGAADSGGVGFKVLRIPN